MQETLVGAVAAASALLLNFLQMVEHETDVVSREHSSIAALLFRVCSTAHHAPAALLSLIKALAAQKDHHASAIAAPSTSILQRTGVNL
jgi:hypothetical protein